MKITQRNAAGAAATPRRRQLRLHAWPIAAVALGALVLLSALLTQAKAVTATAQSAPIEGVIRGANGQPVHGARAVFADQIDITGKDGLFRLEGVTGDPEVRLSVYASGYADRSVRPYSANQAMDITLQVQPVKAIYYNPLISRTEEDVDRLIELIDTTELNAIVVDIKEEIVLYDTQVKLFRDAGTVNPVLDLPALLSKLAEHDIYTIARLVAFKDSIVAEEFPDLAVLNSETGDLWRDMNGVAWVNPTDPALWEANSDLAVEAFRLGFDEIQYDYVRFPTDGDLSTLFYGEGVENTEENRVAAIAGFLKMSNEKLWPLGGKLSADIFGYTLLVEDDLGIGQHVIELSQHVDYLSPMVYPSHFPEGSLAVDGHPNAFPYETIEISMRRAKAKLPDQMYKIRPWLQDFTFFDLPPEYGNDEVRAQIDAAEDTGTSGWMLWDPNNVYRGGALAPADAADPHAGDGTGGAFRNDRGGSSAPAVPIDDPGDGTGGAATMRTPGEATVRRRARPPQ